MNRLIFHIGPGKCGSSTIQQALSSWVASQDACSYLLLDPKLIIQLDHAPPVTESIAEFKALISHRFQKNATVILSHEHIFQRVTALAAMVDIARAYTHDISIIGYSRRPSAFLQSAYCQWIFRSSARAQETQEHLADAGFAPDLFSGLERHFIAALLTGLHSARQMSGHSIVDWKKTYDAIEKTTVPSGASLCVGTIPGKDAGFSLVEDFFRRCRLDAVASDITQSPHANLQFDLDLVEATQLAILNGFDMPGPNQKSGFFGNGSALMPAAEYPETPLLDALKASVDVMLWPSNAALAQKYGFDPTAMRPKRQVGIEEALAATRSVQQQRARDPGPLFADRTRIAARLAKLAYGLFEQD